jgi:7,8-dihydropterin-6-yl-methyl-4-(beta-D-ribofuranosyl)aminobenzene 5'-phosphate synthase
MALVWVALFANSLLFPVEWPVRNPHNGARSADVAVAASRDRHVARSVRVTVLSTMLAGDPGRGDIGEWGFAALVEVDGRRLLFDTGARPETVLENARSLGIDLADVTELVISHNHSDHTGGLLTLRRELAKRSSQALSRAHVAAGIFQPRTSPNGEPANGLLPFTAAYEATGGVFITHGAPTEIMPGVWLTGPVPRAHPERNYGLGGRLQTAAGTAPDSIPEDASLVIDTADGLIVLTGCGHAGVVNIVEYARTAVRAAPIHAVIGGLHTFAATDEQLAWTAEKLRGFGLAHLLGAHCTGIEAVYRLRQLAGLERRTAVVSAVGSSFTLGKGIDARALAR